MRALSLTGAIGINMSQDEKTVLWMCVVAMLLVLLLYSCGTIKDLNSDPTGPYHPIIR